MSQIKSSGTTPELRIEALLRRWLPGTRISVSPKNVFGHPDILIRDLNLVIFIDGCFFHGCPKHYRAPATNPKYWSDKVKRNKKRDKLVNQTLKAEGYTVLRIWEHEVRAKSMPGRDRIRRRIRRIQKLAATPLIAAETRQPYNEE